jgi:MFS transporter, putative metabolite transport protein
MNIVEAGVNTDQLTPATSETAVIVRDKRDIYQFVNDRARGTSRSKLLVVAALASVFVDCWDLAGFGAGVPSVIRTFSLTPSQVGTLNAAIGLGAVIAAIFGGYLVDRLGRLRMFVLDMLLFVVAAVVCAFAPNVAVLVTARFLMGVGIGLDIPAAMSMVAEHSNTAHKRINVNRNTLWQSYAMLASYIASWLLFSVGGVGDHLWRWQIGLGGVLALAILLTRVFMAEESAFWLASRGQLHAAAAVLEKTYHVSVRFEATPAASRPRARYTDIFRRPYLMRTMLATAINLFQSVVYFAVGFYMPVIASHLFKSFSVALLGTAALQIAGIVGSLFCVKFANRLGPRREAAIGFAVEVPLLIFLGTGLIYGWLSPLAGMIVLALFIAFHTFGPAQTGIGVAALSYPTELRGQGTGFSFGFGRLGAMIGLFLFPILLGDFGLGKTILILALAPLSGAIIAFAIQWNPTGAEADLEEAAASHA